ncbi:pyrroline-5-carboxylate reductase [Prolixibacteraceae bacterium JC049]|nr:pyrroline-5-carboxylate reductase [Prolixibacteraceae bacterium JC049]
MFNKRITIIGGGNLGGAIARGLLKSELVKAEQLTVTRRRVRLLSELKEMRVNVSSDNLEATAGSDIIVLAVKPYQVFDIINSIMPNLSKDKIVISVVAGIGLNALTSALGEDIPLFRAMPNTAIALQESMTCISFEKKWEEHKELVQQIFDQLGQTAEIPEDLMGSATVLGSCGIAFALRFIRAAMQGGVEIGFGAELAQKITAQTVKGATELILNTGHHPEREIDKVTTPRGITISGLNEMEHQGFSSSLIQGLITSFNKIERENQD